MATYEIKGKVEAVGKTQAFGQRGFKKRNFVIEEDSESKYPNLVQFTLKQDRTTLADSLNPGDYVTVKFAVEGRKWEDPKKGTTRFFVNLVALRIDNAASSAAPAAPTPSVPEVPADAAASMEEPDDLPF